MLYLGYANKRHQLDLAIPEIDTPITALVDDHSILPAKYLNNVLPEFDDPSVGLCGTAKVVRRRDLTSRSLAGKCWERFWNVMGMLYLERHNFEMLAANIRDGGVMVISGRASFLRTAILQDPEFREAFRNEKRFGKPMVAGDDNCITSEVARRGWTIQFTDRATLETIVGDPCKFLQQCVRWRRTTFQYCGIL